MHNRGMTGLLLAFTVGCPGPADMPDAATPIDTGIDAPSSTPDSSLDAPTTIPDTGVDAPSDAGIDASGTDGGSEAGPRDPRIVTTGTSGVILRGTVVTPTGPIEGEVLVVGDTITCVAASCASATGAGTATIVETEGVIAPGLIDMDAHSQFRIFDTTDWSPTQSYTNHDQWTSEPRYGAMLDAKQYLDGEGGSPIDDGCELDKYAEIMGLIAGTTSMATSANPANRACYGSLARTIDQTPNGLGSDHVQLATLFPATSAADGVCDNFADGSTNAYLVHVSEGIDDIARNELTTLGTVTTTDDCLFSPHTTLVHGTALQDADLVRVGTAGMGIVWMPQSDVFLYGGGTDLTRSLAAPLARTRGVSLSLGSGFIGGSQNLLDAMRYADHVDDTVFGNQFSSEDFVRMATEHAAHQLGLSATLGSITVGTKADLLVVRGDRSRPYDAILATHPADVRLVMVGGVALYGDTVLRPLAAAPTSCEAFDACGSAKFLCVATTSSTSTDHLAQTLADIRARLTTDLTAYDAMNLSAWDFAPIAPLLECP